MSNLSPLMGHLQAKLNPSSLMGDLSLCQISYSRWGSGFESASKCQWAPEAEKSSNWTLSPYKTSFKHRPLKKYENRLDPSKPQIIRGICPCVKSLIPDGAFSTYAKSLITAGGFVLVRNLSSLIGAFSSYAKSLIPDGGFVLVPNLSSLMGYFQATLNPSSLLGDLSLCQISHP